MKNSKKKIIIYVIAFIICSIVAFFLYKFFKPSNKNNEEDNEEVEVITSDYNVFENKTLRIIIDNEVYYTLLLEDNLSARDLYLISPLELVMEDNGVAKVGYLSTSLLMNSEFKTTAERGDLMLSDTNCITLYYEDTELDQVAIKLGHIEKLNELNTGDISISFDR